MTLLLFRSKVNEDAREKTEAASAKMFAALHDAEPEGVRYASTKTADGTYLIFLQLDDPQKNPLAEVPAWIEFQANLKHWVAESEGPDALTVIGSYRLFE
jgi:hypothetical protein